MWAEPSAHKRLLFAAGLAAIVGMSLCVLLSVGLLHGLRLGLGVKSLAVALFLAALLLCVPIVALLNEYTRILLPGQSAWRRLHGWKRGDIKNLVAACPQGIRFASLAVSALALFQCLRLGHFAVRDPGIAAPDVIGILAGATFFFGLCVPVLLSAAFMPGTYAEQLRDPPSRVR
jgi:hypothetical protein